MIEIIAGGFLLGFVIWAFWYIKKFKNNHNDYTLEFIPNLFPTLGMLGTFGGIAYGLHNFDADNLEDSIPNLLQGLTTAFYISIGGVFCLLIFSFIINRIRHNNVKDKKSDEVLAIEKIIEHNQKFNETLLTKLEDIHNSLHKMNYIDYQGYQVHIGNILLNISEDTKQQTQSLQNFSTDLANTIQTGFRGIKEDTSITDTITNSFDKLINDSKVTEKLDSVKSEISVLGEKLQSPAEDVVKGLSDSLSKSMESILHKIQGSIGEGLNSDMSKVAQDLTVVSNSLKSFPDKINTMSVNLEKTFNSLQEGLKQTSNESGEHSKKVTNALMDQLDGFTKNLEKSLEEMRVNAEAASKNTLGLSEESTKAIKEQFEIISKTVNNQSNNHEQNIIKTTLLLEAINKNIEQLNVMSSKFEQTINHIYKANENLTTATSQFLNISDKIANSSTNLSEAQQQLINYNDQVLNHNQELIKQYVSSLEVSKNFNNDLLAKYDDVHNKFNIVFDSVDNGINTYSNNIKNSVQSFLEVYNSSLSKGTESLENAVSVISDSIEDLSDLFKKVNQ